MFSGRKSKILASFNDFSLSPFKFFIVDGQNIYRFAKLVDIIWINYLFMDSALKFKDDVFNNIPKIKIRPFIFSKFRKNLTLILNFP